MMPFHLHYITVSKKKPNLNVFAVVTYATNIKLQKKQVRSYKFQRKGEPVALRLNMSFEYIKWSLL